MKGKSRFLVTVYKTTGNLILPCLAGFFSLCHLSLAFCVQASQKDLNCFFSSLMLAHTCLLWLTQLSLPEHPSNHPALRVSHSVDNTYSASNISSCQFLYQDNNDYTNYNTNLPPLGVPLMKRIISLVLGILSLASTSLGAQF